MIVEVSIPDRVWWRLCEVAEQRGVRGKDIIQAAVAEVVYQGRTANDRIRELVIAGLPDGEISKRVQVTPTEVARRRRAMGLPANRRYPARRPINERKTA